MPEPRRRRPTVIAADAFDVRRRSILAAGLGGLATALLGPGVRADAGTAPLQFGLTPVFLTNDLDLLAGLRGYLEAATGAPVRLLLRRTYQEITALLVSGQLDAAWICGYPFVQYRDALSLVAVPVWRGRPLYQSYLIVRRDRRAESVEDLEGDIHAFSDPDSNSGHLVTQALLARKGRRPETYFRRVFFTYGHRNVVRAVASGLAESGSVDGYVWEVLNSVEPALTRDTKVVRRSEWLGFPPVAAARRLAAGERVGLLRRALLTMSDSPAGRDVLSMLQLDGFQDSSPALFDSIARKVDLVRSLG